MTEQQPPHDTPWGTPQQIKKMAEGVFEISTASHGGFWLSPQCNSKVDPKWRNYASQWSHGYGDQWYEEDVAAYGVIETFPDLFPIEYQDYATKARATYLERSN